MKTVRLFIAIDIPENVKLAFGQLQNSLNQHKGGCRWTSTEHIHVTLKFIGEVPEINQNDISEICKSSVKKHRRFNLSTGEMGAFPNFKAPKVFWVGLGNEGIIELKSLQRETEQNIVSAGFAKSEHRFVPHLTIGRVKRNFNLEEISTRLMKYDFPKLEIPVTKIHLYKSCLTDRGYIYRICDSFFLQ